MPGYMMKSRWDWATGFRHAAENGRRAGCAALLKVAADVSPLVIPTEVEV